MKRFLKTIALMLVLTGVFSCSPEEDLTPQSLEVTPNNISGVWKLADVNGQALPEGVYCYIEFVRRDRTVTMYQKFDSMYPRCITGVYSIEKDPYKGYVLSGEYDYGMGEWNNDYIVTSLYETTMTLTADNETGEISKYERCDEVPSDIIDSIK